MATVRAEGARRLGVIIGVLFIAGVVTAIVRAGNDSSSPSITAQAPVTTTSTGEPITAPPATVPTPTAPTSAPATAGGANTGTATPTPAPSTGSGLSTSGPGAAATTAAGTTGGPLPLLPGLAAVGGALVLRKRGAARRR
jgi:hypothetical protein